MSNHLAVATVTATIRYMLLDQIKDLSKLGSLSSVAAIEITTKPPDTIGSAESDSIEAGLNLFLYQVTPNEGYGNFDLPTRDATGIVSKKPLLSLNLNYLVTAYAKDKDDIKAQQILGGAMQILYENPVLRREQIRAAEDRLQKELGLDMGRKWNSNLADQLELVKLTSLHLSLEDITKLWSSFFQTHYRLSAAYQATVVLIESKKEPKAALPVSERAIYILPFKRPVIDKVEPQILQLNSGAKLSIMGRNLKAADGDNNNVIIKFGEHFEKPDSANITENKISIGVPTMVGAGIRSVKVVHLLKLGLDSEAREHKAFESNIIPFVLAPKITKIAGEKLSNITMTTTPISVTQNFDLEVQFKPPVTSTQEVSLVIGDHTISIPWKAMERRVFNWNVVEHDEGESNNLKDFLKDNFDLEWAHDATLTVVDSRRLTLSRDAENIVKIKLDREPADAKKAILSIKTPTSDNDNFYEFVVRNEESILNVYAGRMFNIQIPTEGETQEQGFSEWVDFPLGTYFVRLRVDGAESVIVDTDPESPTFRQLIGPRIQVVGSGT